MSCSGRIWRQIEALQQRIAVYEKRLKDVSKDRETRVRRAPIELRALMAYEMQDMDREVLSVGRELALCTLDVQLDVLYIALEDEARQILDVEPGRAVTGAEPAAELARVVPRRGSTEELSIFLAQFALLMRRQASLRNVFQVTIDARIVPQSLPVKCTRAKSGQVHASAFHGTSHSPPLPVPPGGPLWATGKLLSRYPSPDFDIVGKSRDCCSPELYSLTPGGMAASTRRDSAPVRNAHMFLPANHDGGPASCGLQGSGADCPSAQCSAMQWMPSPIAASN